MRNIFFGIFIALCFVFVLRFCEIQKETSKQLEASTALIQKELKNVGKLVVTEGSYAQVFDYSNNRELFYGVIDISKKALVVVNAKASIAYDLSKVETQINEATKTVTITKIPEPELTINPDIEYYDLSQNYLNRFTATDHNIIKQRIENSLRKEIEDSELRTNAENRLISELQKIYILTNSMGWKLEYRGNPIEEEQDFQRLKL